MTKFKAGESFARDSCWDVVAIRYGMRHTSKADCFMHYEAFGEPNAPLVMDYYFYLLRSGDRTVLIDTGFDPSVAQRRRRTCLIQPLDALAQLGVLPESVSHILVTHFHWDHTGNLAAFPNAELVVHQRELAFWMGPMASRLPPFHVEPAEITVIAEAHAAGRVRVVEATEATFLPGIDLVHVGGHSPGQLVAAVNGARGKVVLASDVVHFYEELDRDRLFMMQFDILDAFEAFDTLRALSSSLDAPIVAGHDPEVLGRFPSVEDSLAPFAVQLA